METYPNVKSTIIQHLQFFKFHQWIKITKIRRYQWSFSSRVKKCDPQQFRMKSNPYDRYLRNIYIHNWMIKPSESKVNHMHVIRHLENMRFPHWVYRSAKYTFSNTMMHSSNKVQNTKVQGEGGKKTNISKMSRLEKIHTNQDVIKLERKCSGKSSKIGPEGVT